MRCAFGNVVNYQKVFLEKLLTKFSFKTNTQLSFMSTKEMKDFTIKDEQISYYVQDILDEHNFISIFERSHKSLVAMGMHVGFNINNVMFNYAQIYNNRCCSLEEPT